MLNKKIHILSTRILSDDLIFLANTSNILIDCYDFLQIYPKEIKHFQNVVLENSSPFVFTSIHAIESIKSLIPNLKTKKCFVIDGNTSNLALSLGFIIKGIATDSNKLALKIKESKTIEVLHCTTKIRRDDLQLRLQKENINYKVIEVYDKKINPIKVNNYDGVMFFSPTQVDAFLIENTLDPAKPAFCVGKTTSQYLKNKNHNNIITSSKSLALELLKSIINYYKIKK
ncbi:MAG: uroporphyrinogen-III synthase [Bacteroidota bacterium]|nr:uroporphyrinogen-III synthase [Bacteroidota bacterium]